jgi:TonB-linked SusC/RagA family outer membrane protein
MKYLTLQKNIIALGLLLCCSTLALGQVRVSGRVLDQPDGEPIIGASVRIPGTNTGTVTDIEGRFVLSVPDLNGNLEVNYTGYQPLLLAVEGRSELVIILIEQSNALDEVVVVGYGVQRKSDLTGAVGSVKAEEIRRIPVPSVEQALQGKMAGVYVSPASGEPGAGATIRIRGTGTLNNASPIFVVDGMILSDISFLNPQDVESVEVLKDASATAIYGNRGSNGVIIITTKKGQAGRKAAISLSTYYGVQQQARQLPLANAAQFAEMYNELRGQDFYPDPAALGEGTNWQDLLFNDAPIANVQLGANGVWRKLAYNVSGNYFNQQGIQRETGFDRYTGRINAEYPIVKSFKIGTNVAYSTEARQGVGGGILGGMYRIQPVFSERDSTGAFSDPTFFGLSVGNPAADLFYKNDQNTRVNRWVGTAYAEWTFWKHFTFRSSYGIDRRDERFFYFEPVFQVTASQLNNLERTTRDTVNERTWLLENTLNFNQNWGSTLRLNALVGQTAQEFNFKRRNTINGVLQPNGEQLRDWAMLSYLGRVNAVLFDRYLVTASLRADGSSRFARQNRWGYFPSVAVGWNIAQEPFLQGQQVFDRIKLRASWGITGNDKIQDYPSLGIITDDLFSAFNDTIQPAATLVNYANADVRWETTRQTDVGLELAVLEGRLSLEADWYRRFTFDILGDLPIPDYVGSGSNPFVNAAQVENTGWDFTLQWRDNRPNFSYNFRAIASPVQNTVLKLNEGKSAIFEAGTAQGDFATRTVVGQPIGAFYGYQVAGVFQNADEIVASPKFGNEKPGDFRFADLNGDGVLNAEDRTNLGSPIPTLTYGFSAGLEVWGFDLALDFFGVHGNQVVNAKAVARFDTPNWETLWYNDRWTGEGSSNTVPRVTNGGHNYRMSDFLVEDGSFFRLRSAVLGYTLPKKWFNAKGTGRPRLYVSGTNIWTRQTYSGYTPEFPNNSPFRAGIDYLNYPMAKTFLMGLDVQF